MSDREKVAWMRALLFIWGPVILPVLLLVLGAPASAQMASGIAGVILLVWGILTAVYLLVLSWRAAYLSGRAKR